MDVTNINSSVNFDSMKSLETSKPKIQKAPQELPQNEVKKVSKNEVESAVISLNKEIEPMGTNLSFGYNQDINQLIVEVKNNLTGEVIRKLPSEEALHLAKKMKELVGLIFDERA